MATRLILETARLLLRECDEGDVDAFHILGSDPVITRYTGLFRLTSREHALEFLRTNTFPHYQTHGYGRWACELRETGTVVGFAGLKWLDNFGEVDIGYRFLPAYWGRGLASEAAVACLWYGFEQLHLPRVIGLVDPGNAASARVLEKAGMTRTGIIDYEGLPAIHFVTEVSPAHSVCGP